MSDPYRSNKLIPYEELLEDAIEWWYQQGTSGQETVIVQAYMKKNKIGEEEVLW